MYSSQSLYDGLVESGLIVPVGVPGIFGRGPVAFRLPPAARFAMALLVAATVRIAKSRHEETSSKM